MNEIINKDVTSLVANYEDYFLAYKEFEETKARLELKEKELKAKLLETMENNGIKKFENDYVVVTYKAPSVRKVIDTDALKEQGLYESFLKENGVKSSVTIKIK